MTGMITKLNNCLAALPDWIYTTIARFAIGFTFLLGGLTKVDENYVILNKTYRLFSGYYFKNIPLPEGVLNVLTFIATYAELILPLLLFIGLGSRFAALGLLIMTIVIQFVVFPDNLLKYPLHGLWAVALLAIMIKGPGPLSIDHWLKKRQDNEL